MKVGKRLLLAIMGTAALGAGAQAADLDGSLKDTPVMAEPCEECILEYPGRSWMVRARILGVIPDESTSDWTIAGTPTPGLDASIDNSIVPELDFTLFLNRNIAFELIAAVTPHKIKGEGLIAGEDIGDVWLLPPTLLVQYHFDLNNRFKPYVGAGINYTVFFNEDAAGPTNGGVIYDNLDLENRFGWALQAGVDICLRNNWYLNIDVKKIWLNTDVSVYRTAAGHQALVEADVDIDPWIVGVGLGYRFGGYLPAPLK